MKTLHRASITAVAVVVLGGCAGMQEKAYAPNHEVDDAAYVATVERVARTRGVTVRWVNVPQKKVKDLQQQ